MKRDGYHGDDCAAFTACASMVGPIIPPEYNHARVRRDPAQRLDHPRFAAGLAQGLLAALKLGNVTPPVGMTLMTAARIAGVFYQSAIRQSVPFVACNVAVLVLASVSATVGLWLPRLIGVVR